MPNGCTCNPSRPPPSYHGKDAINTVNIPFPELKEARKAAGLHQHQVATILNYSADVIGAWESGQTRPDPDIVDKLEKLYKRPGLWHRFMRHYYDSYRDRYPESPQNTALAVSMMDAKYQLSDVPERLEKAIRDVLDGKIDDKAGFADCIKEAKEAHAALGKMLAQAEMEGNT